MNQIILLSIAIIGLALWGGVHAAPPSSVNHTDVVVMTLDAPEASSTPAQLAKRDDGCICCRKTHSGVTRCKRTTRWHCRLRGGWCAEEGTPKEQ